MSTVYIVLMKNVINYNPIAKIFDSQEKAKDYIKEQEKCDYPIEWDIEAWVVF